MTTAFYDELAPYYDLLYPDWEASIARQGAALAAILVEHGVQPGAAVLDAACGIGTQTIGLAQAGFRVRGSDVAPRAVDRARAELARRGLAGELMVADLRTLATTHREPVAAVVVCDNAVPHLLSDDEIHTAFRQIHRCLVPGGLLVISVRDYAMIPRRSPDVHPYGMRYHDGHRFLAVQVWEWEGEQYDVRLYLTQEAPDGTCETRVLQSRYYAVSIARLQELMREAGFARVERRDRAFFQPLVLGVRNDAA